ncbi:mandelate racemase [Verticiella sediminum]|uniref:Mandelate racemase n=1 Tax=Verticiella sediminum TaxID=1247510 RepID=A0A556ABL6_9BURK|nr:enolase C-terminal domain-like protein [Verticiella sediminum]TSH90289.1 mandelate racemase [Verticiella sediminum]
MKIVDIREIEVPLKSRLRNAVYDFSEMTTSVVGVKTDVIRNGQPVIGYSFNSTGRYACGAQMRQRLIKRILSADPESLLNEQGNNLDPEKILGRMMLREKPGGHSERSIPIGTIEVAVWDAVAKIEDRPLYSVLAQTYGAGRVESDRIPCYVGGGWYTENKGVEGLEAEIRSRLEEGYTTMKIKVGGAPLGEDIARVEAALRILGDGRHLAVDANAGLSPDRARNYAGALSPYRLRWFEEPTDPLDFQLLGELTQAYEGAIGTGENLFSTQDVNNLILFGGLRADRDIIQVDVPQSYGIVQFSRTLRLLESAGWSRTSIYPHGGNQMTSAIVAGFGLGGCEAYPDAFGAFAGFHDGARVENGFLHLGNRPGIGFEAQNDLFALMRELF